MAPGIRQSDVTSMAEHVVSTTTQAYLQMFRGPSELG
jgi:hypothetical protein